MSCMCGDSECPSCGLAQGTLSPRYVVRSKNGLAYLTRPRAVGDTVGWVNTTPELYAWQFETRAGAERARDMHAPGGAVLATSELA